MGRRQLLRAFEVRSPSRPKPLGRQTDRQVRQYADDSGDEPLDKTLDEFADVVTSRLRLNAGSSDWRIGPAPGQGGGGEQGGQVVSESLLGARDGQNLVFTTSAFFYPQTLRLDVNGLRQVLDEGGEADFTVAESRGQGTGYDTITLSWPPLAQDRLQVEYTEMPQGL